MKFLIAGAGGFIGGHLVKRLIELGNKVIAVDIKKLDSWYQIHDQSENFELDLSLMPNCIKVTKNVDGIFNLACNMGGMGFIENNKALCMISVLINTHLLLAAKQNKVRKFFFSSSACAYNVNLQSNDEVIALKETDAYPAMPEDGYGWEKLFSERMCNHFFEDYGMDVKVARYHNIYGPNGTYDGGREKAPAALSRKIIISKLKGLDEIEVWGDGNQKRSFLYIDDCIDASINLFNSNFSGPINIGSEEMVTINQMISILEKIANKKFKKKYLLDKPKGVKGRNSDNTLIKKELQWEPKYSLSEGLKKTYYWIENQIKNK
jgi:nucleoside-diphosphate-sugar epimerase